jgi:hypothetical protein
MQAAALGVAALSLVAAVPASSRCARECAPIFRAFDDMAATAHGGDRVDMIGMHAIARRPAEWSTPILPARVALAPHGREWLALIDAWKANPSARIWFVADPVRTDLALFDPHAREVARAYTWGFTELPFVGGARPNDVDWLHMQAPGWMLDRGWSLTAEVGGITAHDRTGPDRRRPSRGSSAGRDDHDRPRRPPHRRRHRNDDRAAERIAVETFAVPPGFFTRILTLPRAPAATPPTSRWT